MRGRLAALGIAAVALIGAGCDDEPAEEIPNNVTGTVTDATVPSTVVGTIPETATAGDDTTGAPDITTNAAGEHVPAAPVTETFQAGDAGSMEVRRFGDRLQAGQVDQADGWSYEVTEMSGDEVEVRFSRDGDEVELRVYIDGDEMRSEVS